MIVFTYEDVPWAETEADEPTCQKSRFPNAISSGKMDDESDYKVSLLAAGTYDLFVAGYDGADFGEVLGFMSDIQVQREQTTIQNIDTDALEPSL